MITVNTTARSVEDRVDKIDNWMRECIETENITF